MLFFTYHAHYLWNNKWWAQVISLRIRETVPQSKIYRGCLPHMRVSLLLHQLHEDDITDLCFTYNLPIMIILMLIIINNNIIIML